MEAKENEFTAALRDKILALPFDLKVCFALMADEDQPPDLRALAAGTAVYVLGPNDIIPDHIMPVGYADDAIIVWVLFDHVRQHYPDTATKFAERFDNIFSTAGDTAAVFRGYLGEIYDWLAGKLPTLPQQIYKGKTAVEYLQNTEAGDFLYEEALAFVTDFDLDEEYLTNHLRGRKVLEALAKRADEEQQRKK
jgi:uncharacterized membrane protein YkvA (DUF1232 family)